MDPATLMMLSQVAGGSGGGGGADVGGAVGGVFKTGLGVAQFIKAKKLEKSLGKRPEYKTPEEIAQMLAIAKAKAAQTEMPGQNILEEKIGAASASGMRQATQASDSSAALMATIAGITGNEQEQLADVGVKASEYRDLQSERLKQSLMAVAPYKDQEFATNKMEPFKEKATAIESLKGSALENAYGGITQTIGAVSGGGKKKEEGTGGQRLSELQQKKKSGTLSVGEEDELNQLMNVGASMMTPTPK
ncbi:MAG: hypothetical protein A2Z57_04030 [Planctomycetes bacterium RIFCSPHIGHO2_12_39_6]|nr:MAG: hypothetical protein A2Z57_04030 [Planctomycetes bacterium RIFCSPHIGHO2_12_39_6]